MLITPARTCGCARLRALEVGEHIHVLAIMCHLQRGKKLAALPLWQTLFFAVYVCHIVPVKARLARRVVILEALLQRALRVCVGIMARFLVTVVDVRVHSLTRFAGVVVPTTILFLNSRVPTRVEVCADADVALMVL